MIKKLKSKIFWLIMSSLTFIILGVVIIFTIINYRNTINTSGFFMNRVYEEEQKENEERPQEPAPNNNMSKIEGFYNIFVKDNQIIDNEDTTLSDEIKQYAITVSNKKSKDGIIGDYIYKVNKEKNSEIMVMLVENKEAINHIKILMGMAIGISIFSIIIIYILAKKVSEIIVRPVEDTFSKQIQFISDSSHELKTPLAVIEANADVLENEIGENKWLGYIQNEIKSMDKLINELLLLAKIENVDSIKEREEFDLSKEIQIDISMFESIAYENKVNLKTNIEDNIKFVGDKDDIKHIISTLLDNAIKHTKSNNHVEINLKKVKDNIIIDVKNEGESIPKEERGKIFERFYRSDKARNREAKRYGLGLAIAKSIVEKYNGVIEVNCENGMTIFTVKLTI